MKKNKDFRKVINAVRQHVENGKVQFSEDETILDVLYHECIDAIYTADEVIAHSTRLRLKNG